PCEVNGGSDPIALRKEFGRELRLFGGVNKQKMRTKEEVLQELIRLTPLLEDGGFIPFCDHRVPEYVPFEVYRYYEREKLAMLGFTQAEVEEIKPLRDIQPTQVSVFTRDIGGIERPKL
ncbi:MAG: hypothetical protein ACUVX8_17655, partial [Candidatus Zipacnadales bacterium]